jgi:hypothetical protein
MNSALKTIKNALEVLPDNVLLEVVEDEWYYDEESSEVCWGWTSGGWDYTARITEGHTEIYDLFMCNVDTCAITWVSYIFLQDKRLATNPEDILHE